MPFEEVYPHGFEEIPNRRPDVTKLKRACSISGESNVGKRIEGNN